MKKYEICSDKIGLKFNSDGTMLELIDNKEEAYNFVGEKGFQLWVKEGFLARIPGESLSQKFSGLTFAPSVIKREKDFLSLEKKEDSEIFKNLKHASYCPVNNSGIENQIELVVEAVGYKGRGLQLKNPKYYFIPRHMQRSGKLVKGILVND